MPKREWTAAEQEYQIREWFARHREDYCPIDCPHGNLPPKVWAEYFQWLLDRVKTLERRVQS